MSHQGHHSCSDFLSLHPLYPTLQIRHPWLTLGTYAATLHALNTAAILRLCDQPPIGEGRVLLSNKVTLGLVGWASLTFTRLHWGASSVHMQAYVMNVCWTAVDRDARLVIIVKNGFSDPTKEKKGRDQPRKDIVNRHQVKALREGCHERKEAQMSVSSREKKNTNRNLARAATKSKSRTQTVSNGCLG